MKSTFLSLLGTNPLLMNRYAGERPSDPKIPAGKKTQKHIDDRNFEKWCRAAYYDVAQQSFFIPAENVEAMLAAGATKMRLGKDFKRDVQVRDFFIPLKNKAGVIYTAESLASFYSPEYRDIRGVVIGKARVDACRPIFRDWRIDFTVDYEDTITEEQILNSLSRNNLGDFRPRFGQFSVRVSKAA